MAIHLELGSEELAQALTPFGRLLKGKKSLGDALIGHRDGSLCIEAGGITSRAKADGEWAGEARVPAIFIVSIAARGVPSGARAKLSVEDGKLTLRMGSTSFEKDCVWETSEKPRIELPMNAGLRELLGMAFANSDAEIERAGATPQVAAAREKMERLVADAAKKLEPLGISAEEIRQLVKSSVLARPR